LSSASLDPTPSLTRARLAELTRRFSGLTVAVVGDYCLDRYLIIDPTLDEPSLETGLTARQVVEVRATPGASGTIAVNLRSLGARVLTVGLTGADGAGYDLVSGLERIGARTELMVGVPDRLTAVYTKPMVPGPGGRLDELNRLDIFPRTPTPMIGQRRLIESFQSAAAEADALILLDQVRAPGTGVWTDRMLKEAATLARRHPGKLFLADSRFRLARFRGVTLKGNRSEGERALADLTAGSARRIGPHATTAEPTRRRNPRTKVAGEVAGAGVTEGSPLQPAGPGALERLAAELAARSKTPVALTDGPDGTVIADGVSTRRIPTRVAPGPIDVVGAGDSLSAGFALASAAGATFAEATLVGNLVASLTVEQLGTTGSTDPASLRRRLAEFRAAR
jgi:bifunctional ADP-heptose synthase (sugar kinase/adenylyltransferase)